MSIQHAKAERFRALHKPGAPFIIPNPWDAGSAQMLAASGAQALATTSSGSAFTLGKPDMGHVSRDETLAYCRAIVAATPLPVSADLENGFGEAPETVAETVRMAAEVGLVGCTIEDTALPDRTAYDFDLALERVRAAVGAARGLGFPFMLTARADGFLTGAYGAGEAVRRLRAFDAAGADVLYAPLLPMDDTAALCAGTGTPVNVLAAGKFVHLSLAEFAAAGAARISIGGGLARLTCATIRDAAQAMFGEGDFSALAGSIGSGA
ncbi:MAG: isocitrate lyase/phosphoenolpyruvate mutase family protein, partial [Paracoccaceae bacterium]